MRMSVTAKVQPWKMKTEVLVGNYDIERAYGPFSIIEAKDD
ncbi:hypothetical protein Spico_0801 [Parasphaerochaeta coccoides DSM 17374]|uniref:Uncharacterized protein n=1 Tax=Parasphaerochaeta coccoides (strain ATCC BAA-1237 / DSM 17374 / SPN1) TaxID=760011 RepID=F4GHC7_PARC1|nr:hypothetical protein Spico_0801 [Parasphaerochaeta coccoides DSM 17374]